MRIWVDADACPAVIKDILYRASERLQIPRTLVANKPLRIPPSRFIRTEPWAVTISLLLSYVTCSALNSMTCSASSGAALVSTGAAAGCWSGCGVVVCATAIVGASASGSAVHQAYLLRKNQSRLFTLFQAGQAYCTLAGSPQSALRLAPLPRSRVGPKGRTHQTNFQDFP